MPFTVSHVAAVWPLQKYFSRWLIFSALIIGSMAPDFHYFLSFVDISRHSTHRFSGIFYYAIPTGTIVFWIYTLFVRQSLIQLLPESLQTRIRKLPPPPPFFDLSVQVKVILSLGLGALTHIWWDIFSWRILDEFLPYQLAQMINSVAGLIILAIWGRQWYNNTPALRGIQPTIFYSSTQQYFWLGCLFTSGCCGFAFAVLSFHNNWYYFFGSMVVVSLTILSIILLVFGAGWQMMQLRKVMMRRQ